MPSTSRANLISASPMSSTNGAQGESLSRVLYGTDLTGGDFVRGCKRLADVLQQIAVAGPYLGKRAETLAPIAKQAYENVNRGIVAYSGVD